MAPLAARTELKRPGSLEGFFARVKKKIKGMLTPEEVEVTFTDSQHHSYTYVVINKE